MKVIKLVKPSKSLIHTPFESEDNTSRPATPTVTKNDEIQLSDDSDDSVSVKSSSEAEEVVLESDDEKDIIKEWFTLLPLLCKNHFLFFSRTLIQ